jgi:hypothetical protein
MQIRISGAMASAHQYSRAAPAEASGSTIAAVASATPRVRARLTATALAPRRRGTWYSRPSSTWAAKAQTAPGRYLASWVTDMIRTAAGMGSLEPRSATTSRQASMLHAHPAAAATAAPATEYQSIRTSAAYTEDHSA